MPVTARRTAAANPALASRPARPSTRASTAAACSSESGPVAVTRVRACAQSIRPACSAAWVPGSRRRAWANPTRPPAAAGEMPSTGPSSAPAITAGSTCSGPAPTPRSRPQRPTSAWVAVTATASAHDLIRSVAVTSSSSVASLTVAGSAISTSTASPEPGAVAPSGSARSPASRPSSSTGSAAAPNRCRSRSGTGTLTGEVSSTSLGLPHSSGTASSLHGDGHHPAPAAPSSASSTGGTGPGGPPEDGSGSGPTRASTSCHARNPATQSASPTTAGSRHTGGGSRS